MLVVSRKQGERVRIGRETWVTVLGVRGNRVRLGFEAPDSLPIHREELTGPEQGCEFEVISETPVGIR